jgi:hypothetical protein
MAAVRTRTWQVVLAMAGILLLIGWVVSGHWITGIAALVLLLGMGGGALMYRFMGPPRQ